MNWTRANGFPANAVNDITQTRDGYLWFASQNGLVRYDGVGFKTVSLPPVDEFRSQCVTTLSPSRSGGCWFGVKNGAFGSCEASGVAKAPKADWITPWMNVARVLEQEDGTLWVGFVTGVARCPEGNPQGAVTNNELIWTDAVCPGARGRVWLGTRGQGVWCWQDGRFEAFPDESIRHATVLALALDVKGRLWVGMTTELRCYDSEFKRVAIPAVPTQIRSLLVDRHGIVWIGSASEGLLRYDGKQMSRFRKTDGLADDSVNAIFEDGEGTIWIGTQDGLSQITDVKLPLYSGRQGLPAGMYHHTSPSRSGGLWLATTEGLTHFDGQHARTLSNTAGFSNPYLKRVYEATNGEVYVMNGQREIQVLTNDHVVASFTNGIWASAFAEDAAGVVVAIGERLFRVNRHELAPYRFQAGQAPAFYYIQNLASCSNGTILVATANGVYRIRDGWVLQHWDTNEGLANNIVLWVGEDDEGAAWAATPTGISLLMTNKAVAVRQQDGLFADYVTAIVPDTRGGLWVNSHDGLFRVNRRQILDFAAGKRTTVDCTPFNQLHSVKSTDLQDVECSGTRTGDGRIWFALSKGLVLIDPAHLPTNTVVPPVFIQRVTVDRVAVTTNRAWLKPGRGDLQFEYTALSYIAPQQVRFRYRLEGYDANWVDAGNRRAAYYTGIPPGSYVFRVQACNEDGLWNTGGAQFEITLPPHFHETRWFRMLCVLLVIAIPGTLCARRIGHFRRRQRELQELNQLLETKVNKRTNELSAQRNLLRTLIDNLPDLVFVKDLHGRVLLDNVAHAQAMGCDGPAEATGKSDRECYPAELAAKYEQDERSVLDTGNPINTEELVLNQKTGQRGWARTTKVPLRDATGQIIGLAGISRDITERKIWAERMASMHKRLMEASRKAGMAEVASDVLHQVGNSLNSVNVSRGVIADGIKEMRVGSLSRAADLMLEHSADLGTFVTTDEKGRTLPAFLKSLAQHLAGQQTQVLEELQALSHNLDQVASAIAQQETRARAEDIIETFHPAELIQDALRLYAETDTDKAPFRVTREFAAVSAIESDRHKCLQILLALFEDAARASHHKPPAERTVRLRLSSAGERIRIQVTHNGSGFARGDLASVFSQTPVLESAEYHPDLHSAAIVAKQMGGSLTAESEGPQLGATFTLELPVGRPRSL